MSDTQEVSYTVVEKSMIGHTVYEPGQTVQYAGLPSANLAPTCDIGKQRAAEYEVQNAARLALLTQTATATPQLEAKLDEFRAEILAAQAETAKLLAGFVAAVGSGKSK